jgi:raffinose/stachyose/melibiose transport system permease protein
MKTGRRLGSAFIFLILLLAGVVTLFPIYMAVLNSLKTEGDMLNSILAIPTQLEFSNYPDAFKKTHFLRSLWNTLVVVLSYSLRWRATNYLGIVGS